MSGKIILLNGASSSGKSTLARGLQARLDEPFWHFSIDHFNAARVLPEARIESGEFEWHALRPQFFAGFHGCLPALAEAGNNLIVEHIVETEEWMHRLLRLLRDLDVFFVGLHCPVAELEARERARRPKDGRGASGLRSDACVRRLRSRSGLDAAAGAKRCGDHCRVEDAEAPERLR